MCELILDQVYDLVIDIRPSLCGTGRLSDGAFLRVCQQFDYERFEVFLKRADFVHVFISSVDLSDEDKFLKEYTVVPKSKALAFDKYALEIGIAPPRSRAEFADVPSQYFEDVHLVLRGIEELTDFCYRLASIDFPGQSEASFRHRSYVLRFPCLADNKKLRQKQQRLLEPFCKYWKGFQDFKILGIRDLTLVISTQFKVCETWWKDEDDFYQELAQNRRLMEQAFDAGDFHTAADLVDHSLCSLVASANMKRQEAFWKLNDEQAREAREERDDEEVRYLNTNACCILFALLQRASDRDAQFLAMKIVRMVNGMAHYAVEGSLSVFAYGAMAYVLLGMESEAVLRMNEPVCLKYRDGPIMQKARELQKAVLHPSEAQASGDPEARYHFRHRGQKESRNMPICAQPPPFEERWTNFRKVMGSWECDLAWRWEGW